MGAGIPAAWGGYCPSLHCHIWNKVVTCAFQHKGAKGGQEALLTRPHPPVPASLCPLGLLSGICSHYPSLLGDKSVCPPPRLRGQTRGGQGALSAGWLRATHAVTSSLDAGQAAAQTQGSGMSGPQVWSLTWGVGVQGGVPRALRHTALWKVPGLGEPLDDKPIVASERGKSLVRP